MPTTANQDRKTVLTVTCPNCGEEHALTFNASYYLLDGTPAIDIWRYLERVHICDCGMLITDQELSVDIVQQPGYKHCMSVQDKVLKKLDLLFGSTGKFEMLTYYAEYYRQLYDMDSEYVAKMRAIKLLEVLKHNVEVHIPPGHFIALNTTNEVILRRDHLLIDLYRRVRNYKDALSLIKTNKLNATPGEMQWLTFEEQLIADKDCSTK